MKHAQLTMPEVALIAGTRVALGAGIALLMADSLKGRERKLLGWGLFLFGAATTIPLAKNVLHKLR